MITTKLYERYNGHEITLKEVYPKEYELWIDEKVYQNPNRIISRDERKLWQLGREIVDNLLPDEKHKIIEEVQVSPSWIMTRNPPAIVITPVVEVQAISIPSAASQQLWAEFGYVIQIISIPQQQQRVIFQPLSKDRYLQVFTYLFWI